MDICSSPGGVSASAHPPPAQNDAEAMPKEAARVGPARRTGAAARLDLGDITESAQALGTSSVSMEGVFPSTDGNGLASAQIEPQGGNLVKESQKSGTRVESTGVEVDVSDWTIEDWLRDHKEAPKQESYKTGEGWWRRNTFVISEDVVPVKVGLLNIAANIGKWRELSLQDKAASVKDHIRKLPLEYKRVDNVRPYGKAGPLCVAAVHPEYSRGASVSDDGFIRVNLDLSGATHGIISSKVSQCYAVLDELAACVFYDHYFMPMQLPDRAPLDEPVGVNFHPRMENFDFSEYKSCVAVAASVDAERLGKMLTALSKTDYGNLKCFKVLTKKDGSVQVEASVGGERLGIWGSLEHLTMHKTVYLEGPERCFFENNHAYGPEILESLFGIPETFGNPRPERSLENLAFRVDLMVPACKWLTVGERLRIMEANVMKFKSPISLSVFGKDVRVSISESFEAAKLMHTDVWSRKVRDDDGGGGGGGGGGGAASAKAISALEGKLAELSEKVGENAARAKEDAVRAKEAIEAGIGGLRQSVLDLDGQLSSLTDDGETTKRDVQLVLTAQRGFQAAQDSIAGQVSGMQEWRQRSEATAIDLREKTVDLALGVKMTMDKVSAVGDDASAIRTVAEKLGQQVAALQVASADGLDIVWASPGGSTHRKKKGPKAIANSPSRCAARTTRPRASLLRILPMLSMFSLGSAPFCSQSVVSSAITPRAAKGVAFGTEARIESNVSAYRGECDVRTVTSGRGAWAGISAEAPTPRGSFSCETLIEKRTRDLPRVPTGATSGLLKPFNSGIDGFVRARTSAVDWALPGRDQFSSAPFRFVLFPFWALQMRSRGDCMWAAADVVFWGSAWLDPQSAGASLHRLVHCWHVREARGGGGDAAPVWCAGRLRHEARGSPLFGIRRQGAADGGSAALWHGLGEGTAASGEVACLRQCEHGQFTVAVAPRPQRGSGASSGAGNDPARRIGGDGGDSAARKAAAARRRRGSQATTAAKLVVGEQRERIGGAASDCELWADGRSGFFPRAPADGCEQAAHLHGQRLVPGGRQGGRGAMCADEAGKGVRGAVGARGVQSGPGDHGVPREEGTLARQEVYRGGGTCARGEAAKAHGAEARRVAFGILSGRHAANLSWEARQRAAAERTGCRHAAFHHGGRSGAADGTSDRSYVAVWDRLAVDARAEAVRAHLRFDTHVVRSAIGARRLEQGRVGQCDVSAIWKPHGVGPRWLLRAGQGSEWISSLLFAGGHQPVEGSDAAGCSWRGGELRVGSDGGGDVRGRVGRPDDDGSLQAVVADAASATGGGCGGGEEGGGGNAGGVGGLRDHREALQASRGDARAGPEHAVTSPGAVQVVLRAAGGAALRLRSWSGGRRLGSACNPFEAEAGLGRRGGGGLVLRVGLMGRARSRNGCGGGAAEGLTRVGGSRTATEVVQARADREAAGVGVWCVLALRFPLPCSAFLAVAFHDDSTGELSDESDDEESVDEVEGVREKRGAVVAVREELGVYLWHPLADFCLFEAAAVRRRRSSRARDARLEVRLTLDRALRERAEAVYVAVAGPLTEERRADPSGPDWSHPGDWRPRREGAIYRRSWSMGYFPLSVGDLGWTPPFWEGDSGEALLQGGGAIARADCRPPSEWSEEEIAMSLGGVNGWGVRTLLAWHGLTRAADDLRRRDAEMATTQRLERQSARGVGAWVGDRLRARRLAALRAGEREAAWQRLASAASHFSVAFRSTRNNWNVCCDRRLERKLEGWYSRQAGHDRDSPDAPGRLAALTELGRRAYEERLRRARSGRVSCREARPAREGGGDRDGDGRFGDSGQSGASRVVVGRGAATSVRSTWPTRGALGSAGSDTARRVARASAVVSYELGAGSAGMPWFGLMAIMPVGTLPGGEASSAATAEDAFTAQASVLRRQGRAVERADPALARRLRRRANGITACRRARGAARSGSAEAVLVEQMWAEAWDAGFRVASAGDAGGGLVTASGVRDGVVLALRGVVVGTAPQAGGGFQGRPRARGCAS